MDTRPNKTYLAVVQCHIVMERCSGYNCERAFHGRSGGFSFYPKDKAYRTIYLTCGGCCGRGVHRKLSDLVGQLHRREGMAKERIAVQLASCVTKDNYHGPPCPHLDYLKTLIGRLGLEVFEDTVISEKAEERRAQGRYTAKRV